LLYSRAVEYYNRQQDDKRANYYEHKLQDLLIKNDLMMRQAELATKLGSDVMAEAQKKLRTDSYVKNTALVE